MKLRPQNFRELCVKLELSMERSVSHRTMVPSVMMPKPSLERMVVTQS